MRFTDFLNEEIKDPKEIIFILQQSCKEYIKDLKKQNYHKLLFSGRERAGTFFEKKMREKRNPTDTPQFISDEFDKAFKKKFGIEARSKSLFCYNNDDYPQSYGVPFAIFPKGKYFLLYSDEIRDLYGNLRENYPLGMKYAKWDQDNSIEKNVYREWENHFGPMNTSRGYWKFEQYKLPKGADVRNYLDLEFGAARMIEDLYNLPRHSVSPEAVEWVPLVTVEEYKQQLISQYKMLLKEIEWTVDKYKKIDASQLAAVDKRVEIMLVCKEYYGINLRRNWDSSRDFLQDLGLKVY